MAELVVRELGEEHWPAWDRFVASSPQGTIFSETVWLRSLKSPFRIFACYKGDELIGGAAVVEDETGENTQGTVPLTPFQGILFHGHAGMKPVTRLSLEMQITEALAEHLEARYRQVVLTNHYTFHDLRPFFFRTFGTPREYEVAVRYTHVVDLRDPRATWSAMDKGAHGDIHKAERANIHVHPSDDFERFDRMHRRTFTRQGIDRDAPDGLIHGLFAGLHSVGRCQLYFACNTAGIATSGVVAIWDNKRAYYWLGASEPEFRNNGSASLTLWKVFQDIGARLPEIDLTGSNSPKRGAFKASFGGELRHYFVVSLKRVTGSEKP